MSGRIVGFGVIGMGRISRAHIKGLLDAHDHARIVAVCDRNEELAKKAAAEIGARAYVDYVDLLNDPDVEAVDAPLPHHLHYEVARRALEMGKHVIVEKPMAPTSRECADLIALAKEKGLRLSVAENTPFVAAYLAVKKVLEHGELGDLRLIRTLISGSEVDRLRDVANWKGRAAGSIGGAMFDAGPHSFYLLKWLFGEFASLQATTNKIIDVSEVEDHAVVTGRLKSGALFTSEFTFTAEIPWGERLEIYGSGGTVMVDQLLDPPVVHYRGKNDIAGAPITGVAYAPDRVEHDPTGWKFRSIAAGLREFARSVAENRPPPVDAADGEYSIRVVESAYRSAKAGGTLSAVSASETQAMPLT